MAEAIFRAKYQLALADYVELSHHAWRQQRAINLAGRVGPLVVGSWFLYQSFGSDDWGLGVMAILLLSAPLWVRWLGQWRIRKAFAMQKMGELETQLSVDATGVEVTGAVGRSDIPWAAVTAVETGREHIFLRLRNTTAIIVPKRAFETVSAAENFTKFVHVHAEAAAMRTT